MITQSYTENAQSYTEKTKKSNNMKKITFLTFLGFILLLASPAKAQSPIAVQNDSGTSFYSTLDLAITNAVAGDYIYIPGGVFPISVPIDKQLHIIGVGHNPDSCAVTGITQVTGNIIILNGSDHGSIAGLKISGYFHFGSSPNDVIINYYTIERCNIGGEITLATRSTNILVNECVIKGLINGNKTQGFKLSKCIVEADYVMGFDSNAYFINNIFTQCKFGYWAIRQNIIGCYVKNNIFLTRLYVGNYDAYSNVDVSKNLFQNNLFNSGHNLSTTSNVFQNNITGPVTTLFKNQTGAVFDYKQDYHILESSPAHNAGTDGTDLGIYGTTNPWKEGSLPSNPHIQSKSISTVNGNLNVKIKVAAQDH